MNIKDCAFRNNKVIILTDKCVHVTELKKEDAKDIDAYIDYSIRSYDNAVAYTKYIIKKRYLDKHSNLILICDEEYHPYE